MSVDRTFYCMIAVRVNISTMQNEKKVIIDHRCEHVKKLKIQPQFCPKCGNKTEKPYEETQYHYKKKFFEMFADKDEAPEYQNVWFNGQEFKHGNFKFAFFDMYDNEEDVLCGIFLGDVYQYDYDQDKFFTPGEPKYPTRKQILAFLKSHGIKARTKSYGVYSWVKVT